MQSDPSTGPELETEPVSARALFVDFGGVLTTDVFASFGGFCTASGLPRDAVRSAFASDAEAQRLLVELEGGRLSEAEFNRRFAAVLGAEHGVEVTPGRLIERMSAGLRLVDRMVDAVAAVRAAGVPTVLVSNSMGYGSYAMLDLESCFDSVVLSGEVGVRKPSRRIYRLGAEAAGVDPTECVLVDDLEQNLSGAARIGVQGILHSGADLGATMAKLEQHFGVILGTRPSG